MKAKLGAIFLISVLAIAGTGAAYALWYEDLTIWTDIHTGNVDVEFSYEGWECDQTKDIAYITGGIEDDEFLYLQFWDVYPCVNFYVYFNVESTGSIPVHFTPMTHYTSLPDGCYEYSLLISYVLKANGDILYPNTLADVQLHQGDMVFFILWIHFNNELPQSSDFTFDFYTTAHQYNEEPGD